MDEALWAYRGNPRAAPILDGFRRYLSARVPELRSSVQRFLTHINLEASTGSSVKRETLLKHESRRPLSNGSHAEVDLRSTEMRWRGIVDLLTVSEPYCEIRDFKTGAPKKEYELQLLTYALLWALDREANPSGRLANGLVVSYEEGDKEVAAPTKADLRRIEDELRMRTATALNNLQDVPPEARPISENCAYCPVRHLCDEYWHLYGREGSIRDSAGTGLGDVQVRLTHQHGPSSWDGVIESGPHLESGAPILLRTGSGAHEFHSGQRLRVLNVHINVPDEVPAGEPRPDPTVVASMGVCSEAFLIAP